MSMSHGPIARRNFLAAAGATAAMLGLPAMPKAQGGAGTQPRRGGTLTAIVQPEPPTLVSALNAGAPVGVVSTNIFDGLFTYNWDMSFKPSLAESWDVSEDGLTITFNLRRGVTWHDGTPFTSADVAFSLEEIWRKIHPRGRSTFINVREVDSSDPHVVVLRLSAPSPVIFSALNSYEAQILPRHVYAGSDALANPANLKPIGTGPFMFKEWVRGEHIVLERNPNYWDEGKPYLDRIVFRIVPDAAARAALLETGQAQYAPYSPVPLSDVARLRALPNIAIETKGYEWISPWLFLEFNLRKPQLADVRVRRAIAHAVNRDIIAKTVWHGFGKPSVSTLPSTLTRFFTADVPQYPFDPKKAEALLEEAGYKRGPDGMRFALSHDFLPYGDDYRRTGEYVRQALRRIGIDLTLRSQDTPSYLRRVFTEYEFDISSSWASSFSDPQIGVQRLFWTKGINKGTPWTNASGYSNPEMDKVLEAAQREADPAKRAALYHETQRIAATDLPNLPLIELHFFTVHAKTLHDVAMGPDAAYSSLKHAWLEG
jgi:peptide/nickel transport system substrate-binding protein